MALNPFHDASLFLCPWEISRNLWFSNVFQGVYKETSDMKWVKDIFNMSAEC